MASFTPLRDETVADQRLYLDGRLQSVACLDCLAHVQVKKNSEFHTSIQWTDEAVRHCAEFARDRANGERVVHASCARLRASIDQAYRDGQLPDSEGTLEPDA